MAFAKFKMTITVDGENMVWSFKPEALEGGGLPLVQDAIGVLRDVANRIEADAAGQRNKLLN